MINFIIDFVGFVAGIISAVFLYITCRYGPGLYRRPLIEFFLGLLFMSFAFAIPLFQPAIDQGGEMWLDFFHHLLMVISILFFADGARSFFRTGR